MHCHFSESMHCHFSVSMHCHQYVTSLCPCTVTSMSLLCFHALSLLCVHTLSLLCVMHCHQSVISLCHALSPICHFSVSYIVTSLSLPSIHIHMFAVKQHLLAIGDDSGTLHILEIPWSLRKLTHSEVRISSPRALTTAAPGH